MKDAKTIIRHIIDNPSYKELKNRSECGEFLKLLSLNHRRLIAFCYEKNGVLFFALFHPLGLQELKRDSSIKMLKGLLKIYSSVNFDGRLARVTDVKFFVTKRLKFKKPTDPYETKRIFTYAEPAKGEFVNLAKSEQIYAKFENIRRAIKQNLEKEAAENA